MSHNRNPRRNPKDDEAPKPKELTEEQEMEVSLTLKPNHELRERSVLWMRLSAYEDSIWHPARVPNNESKLSKKHRYNTKHPG